ncbi:MAG: hypothetical protein OXC63_01645 [Aestuariivita sp.]|nr:hypothetical protein [Aestuariivita sp.]MCY4348041.1 hypothetical protein [Aestuariivita sp.]
MDVQEYLVTLSIHPAELSGLKELPGSSKDIAHTSRSIGPMARDLASLARFGQV